MASGANISEKIQSIITSKGKIRDWLIQAGKAEAGSDLEACSNALSLISVYMNAQDFNIAEGASYTIPAGYHDGTQVITNVSEEAGGAYTLYSYGTITPTKTAQSFPVPTDYYGLSAFSVAAIPEAYQDVTPVTVTADKVLTGYVYVDKTGNAVTGTMPNNGKVTATFTGLSAETSSYTIPKGYHDGGTVSLTSDIEDLLAEI